MFGKLIGRLVAVITFPGIIVHEIAHQLFCIIFKTAVFEVCYFQLAEPMGYVRHEKPKNVNHTIMIAVGPFLVNTIIAAVIGASVMMTFNLTNNHSVLDWIAAWLGLSIGAHAFPSIPDAQVIWKSLWKQETKVITKIIGAPIVGLIYIMALGSVIWLDIAWGAFSVNMIPLILSLF